MGHALERLDRPLEGEVCEGGRVVASGNLEWPGGGCVGLFTTPELASSASRGSFLAPEFSVSCQTIGLGLWQPWLKVSGRFGDVDAGSSNVARAGRVKGVPMGSDLPGPFACQERPTFLLSVGGSAVAGSSAMACTGTATPGE